MNKLFLYIEILKWQIRVSWTRWLKQPEEPSLSDTRDATSKGEKYNKVS